jgi:hypothetical protein
MNISQKHRRTRRTIAQKRITTVHYRWMKKLIEQNNDIKVIIAAADKNEPTASKWWEN